MSFVVSHAPVSIESYSMTYSKTMWKKSVMELYFKGNTIYATVSVTGGSGYMGGTATLAVTYKYYA